MNIGIYDTALRRSGSIRAYDGAVATVQWHDHWDVTGVTKQKLESGRYRLEGND